MTKLALALSVLATIAAGIALVRKPAVETPRAATGDARGEAVSREVKTLAQEEAKAWLTKAMTADVDRRIVRLEQIRKDLERSIAEARRLGEASADAVAARVDTVERDSRQGLKAVRTELDSLQRALGALRDRPAPEEEPASSEPAPAAPPEPAEEKPAVPSPTPAPEAPAVSDAERKEIDKALADLEKDDVPTLFTAMESLRKKKVKEATPRIAKILGTHKDEFARMAAATALGGIGVADGMDALIEALVDDSPSVATQASKAIRQIAGLDLEFSARAGIVERRKARTKAKQWWKDHETEVRERLGQPKGGGP